MTAADLEVLANRIARLEAAVSAYERQELEARLGEGTAARVGALELPTLRPGVAEFGVGVMARTIDDEFAATTTGGIGFLGTWADFLANGLYNAVFRSGVAAGGTVPVGRTVALPYWTLSNLAGSPVVTREADVAYPSGFYVKVTFNANGASAKFLADRVSVVPGQEYELGYFFGHNVVAGTSIEYNVAVTWRNSVGTAVGTGVGYITTFAGVSAVNGQQHRSSLGCRAPVDANFADVQIVVTETVSHSASNFAEIGGVTLRPVPMSAGNGTSFPTAPITDDRFYRTDLDMEFFFDGTRWLCTCPHVMPIAERDVTANVGGIGATTVAVHRCSNPSLFGGSDIWLEQVEFDFDVNGGTALSASHKWAVAFAKGITTPGSTTTIVTLTIDSGASSVWRKSTVAIDALMNNGTTHFLLQTDYTKTGTPGNLIMQEPLLTYRIVAT